MIVGSVNAALEARISLNIQDTTGRLHALDVKIDTGYDGFLTLPPARIAALGLIWIYQQQGHHAGGSQSLDTYAATLEWDGKMRPIEVDAVDLQPLAGTALLERHTLEIDFVPGGSVTITAIP